MLSAAEISLQFRLGTGEQTPKNFQNRYCDTERNSVIFLLPFSRGILRQAGALLVPKATETPSLSVALAPIPALRRKRERTVGE